MAKIFVQVWLKNEAEVQSRAGRFNVIETDAEDFGDFCDMVNDDVLIMGEVLHTRRIDETRAEITRRQTIAFRGSSVMRCQPNTLDVVEPA